MSFKSYREATHRSRHPSETLARISPHLARFGITRCADITGLDKIGIPTMSVFRPGAATVQVSSGKGSNPLEARVSGLMEAIELHHAESPPALRRASIRELRLEGASVRDIEFPEFDEGLQVEWVQAETLETSAKIWVPASMVYYLPARRFFRWSSNGLASGNDLTEATLHALYEIIERHSLSQLLEGSRIRFDLADPIDVDSIAHPILASLVTKVRTAGIRLLLLRCPVDSPVHTFLAVYNDPTPMGLRCRVDLGSGAHLDPAVAAIRAVTEAAQGRLSVIHGSREDLKSTAYQEEVHQRLFGVFTRLDERASAEGRLPWRSLTALDSSDLEEDLDRVLGSTEILGPGAAYRVDMTFPDLRDVLSVVKVIVPRAREQFPL